MAKIQEEHIIIKVSYLTKDESGEPIVTAEVKAALEQVAGELIGAKGVVVEVIDE